jgi:ketosteroid isomerase-like protein
MGVRSSGYECGAVVLCGFMSSLKPQSDEAAVLRANANFYRAFSIGDFAAMSQLWAQHAEVTCLHPGATLLRGRADVLSAWRQLISEPAPLEMRCERPTVQLYETTAVVTCYEGNSDQPAHLAATNVFVLEGGEWRMVHHQAGALAQLLRASGPIGTGPGSGGPGTRSSLN